MKKVIFCMLTTIFLFSCEKKDDPGPQIQETPDYCPLAVGNYWIYQHYLINEDESETLLTNRLDSVYISRDTVINSEVYYVMEGSRFLLGNYNMGNDFQIIRDSLGFIIDENGRVLLASSSGGEILREFAFVIETDTLYTGSYSMINEPLQVTVPAGVFEVLNRRSKYSYMLDGKEIIRYTDDLFARDVGEVRDTYFYQSVTNLYYERRLIRYHIVE